MSDGALLPVVAQGALKRHQYQVVGRHLPTEAVPEPTLFRMKLWATNEISAKSKFWCGPPRPHLCCHVGRAPLPDVKNDLKQQIHHAVHPGLQICIGRAPVGTNRAQGHADCLLVPPWCLYGRKCKGHLMSSGFEATIAELGRLAGGDIAAQVLPAKAEEGEEG